MTLPRRPLAKASPLPRDGAAPPRDVPAAPGDSLRVPGLGGEESLALFARVGDYLASLSDPDFRRIGESIRAAVARREGREPPAPLFPRQALDRGPRPG